MKAIINVAEMGRGKSTETFDIIRSFGKKDLYAYDPNQEYVSKGNKVKGMPTKQQFINVIASVRNSVIVFEEATVFFRNSGNSTPDEIIDLLVRNHHMKNIIVFNFHSVRAIPVDIMDYVGFINIWHTLDRMTLIKSKYKNDTDLLELFIDVHTKTYGTEKNRTTGVYKDENSKQFYHYKRTYAR